MGNRWEAVARATIASTLAPSERLIAFAAESGLAEEVFGTNLAHADALRAFAGDGRLVLEPLDFKWSLETANVKQIGADTLVALLDRASPLLRATVAAARDALGLPADAPVEAVEGRFVAPVHPANRAALRDDPDLPVLLLRVDARAFFEPLPAWDSARAVAAIEGGNLDRLPVDSLEAMERYYRIGAGVAGAFGRLKTGLFDEEAAVVDVPSAVAALRRSGRAPTLNALVVSLDRQLSTRRALEEQLTAIPRAAYPFARLRHDLQQAGAPRGLIESRGALGRVHGDVIRAVLLAARAEGRRHMAEGASEVQALAALAETPERWAAVGSQRAGDVARRMRTAAPSEDGVLDHPVRTPEATPRPPRADPPARFPPATRSDAD